MKNMEMAGPRRTRKISTARIATKAITERRISISIRIISTIALLVIV
jgi:hypothetical protein